MTLSAIRVSDVFFFCFVLFFVSFVFFFFFSDRSELIYAGPCTGDLGGTGVGVVS